MKQQWQQQQQQQMRRQQELLQQRRKAAAWMEQQKAKQKKADVPLPVRDRFDIIEQAAASLRQQMTTGKLTQEQAQTQMKEMMVQDDDGVWWTVGFETGGWYKYSDDSWIEAQPPRLVAPNLVPSAPTSPAKPQRFLAVIVLIIGLAITAGVGFLAGQTAYGSLGGDTEALIVASIFWLTGLWLTIKKTRKLWRGK